MFYIVDFDDFLDLVVFAIAVYLELGDVELKVKLRGEAAKEGIAFLDSASDYRWFLWLNCKEFFGLVIVIHR